MNHSGEVSLTSALPALAISLFEHLQQHFAGRLEVFECTKATLVHVSHTLEDLILQEQMPAVLLTGFQESSHWRKETERYRALAEVAQQVCIFSGGQLGPEAHAREIRVTLVGDDPLRQEWFVCALAPRLSFVLCGQDQRVSAAEEPSRRFATFWTFEPAIVSEVLDLLEDVLARYRPDRLAGLREARAQLPPAQPDARLMSRLMAQLIRFEDRLQIALHEREIRYRTLVEQVPAMIYTGPPDDLNSTSYISSQVESILGYTPAEWLADKQLWLRLLHPGDRARVQAELARVHEISGSLSMEYRAYTRDGRLVWLHDSARMLRDPEGQPLLLQGLILDMSERKRAEQRSLAFAALGRQLGSAATASDAARTIARVADELIGWDAFVLSMYDATADAMRHVLFYDVVNGERAEVALTPPGSPSPTARRVLADGALLLCNQNNELSPLDLRSFGDAERESASLMFVPIHDGDNPVGVLSIQSYTPHAYTQADLAALQALADHCGGALDRIRTEEALYISQGRLSNIIESAHDAIITLDAQRRITIWNAGAEQMFHCSAAEALGQPLDRFIPERFRVAHRHLVEGFGSGADLNRAMGRVRAIYGLRANGEEFPIEASISQVGQGDEQTLTVILRDITERKRFEAELAQARDQALAASRMKSEFLATMSHEIRTPMNGIIGMTELLRDTQLDGEQREFATIVHDSAQALLTIINDILDFSKVEAGKLILEQADFELLPLLEGSAELLAGRARDKRLELMTYIAPDVPPLLCGDAGRLRQVLLNLIGNAVKFTEQGSIVVSATRETSGDAGVMVRFSVRDTGIGMPPAVQRRLFQPFTQADGSITRKYGGTGLGLAISRHLAELMGGAIGAESAEGLGSTFWFTARFSPPRAAAAACPPAPLPPLRTLIAGQHAVVQEVLLRYLQGWGLAADSALSGGAALVALRQAAATGAPYDLVLAEMDLPDLDGFALARVINHDQALAGARLVLLAAFDQRAQGEQALGHGFSAYVTKPVKQAQLYGALAQAADARAKCALPEVHEMGVARNPQLSNQLILLVEDHAINQQLARLQLSKLGYSVRVAANGQEAVDAVAGGEQFALILMDCQMPVMDGYAASRAIRRLEGAGCQRTPIIAMTANAMESDREACIQAGMDDYLSKPVRQAELTRALERWLASSLG